MSEHADDSIEGAFDSADLDGEPVPAGEYDYGQQSACIAMQDWAIEALKRGVHEDDIRRSFEKALEVGIAEVSI